MSDIESSLHSSIISDADIESVHSDKAVAWRQERQKNKNCHNDIGLQREPTQVTNRSRGNSIASSGQFGKIYSLQSLQRPRTTATNVSGLSRVTTIRRALTEKISYLRDAVNDDNQQTWDEEAKVENILKSNFTLGDAMQLNNYYDEYSNQDQQVNDPETGMSINNIISNISKLAERQQNNDDSTTLTNKSESIEKDVFSSTHSSTNMDMTRAQSNVTMKTHQSLIEKVFTNKETGETDLPPDGGYGWVSTLCTFLVIFSTWGCNSGFGVFLSFYLNNHTFKHAGKYDYPLIAGFTVAMGPLFSPFSMILMRLIGLRQTMWVGIMMLLAGFLMASYAVSLWELYLTQGFLVGSCYAFTTIPATTVIPGWFLKKRAVAMGISFIGTGAGGMTYGLAAGKMIHDNHGTRKCLRVFTLTCSVVTAFSAVLIRPYKKEHPIGLRSWKKIKNEFKMMFDLKVLSKPVVLLVGIWYIFALFGYTLMVLTLSAYVIARGYTERDGASVLAILNGCQAVGRPIIGFIGDKVGRINITSVLTLILVIFMYAFWIPAYTFVQLIFFAICTGSVIGVANVMSGVLTADVVPPEEFLAAWAFVNYVGSPFLLVCDVIAQALEKRHDKNPYLHTQIFSGGCFACSFALLAFLREVSVKKVVTQRQELTLQRLNSIQNGLEEVTIEEQELLEKRREKYETLLGPSWSHYFGRMFYPIKV
ncbi:hypothetical protein TBLA_0B07680 [Henningerozyma blattae CBS 6284]|uniref:Major facilitator superfamily (MFS) profile domain-containing protein n=1 Tax=Henningerozyma blattae (strain ATCC 34711 / CBS 6284 / DSM 70876 / NBRC 10599 / NRRL Y-10934 / UCD 77-7) TaxID=1071380 RepID=I2GZN2_HENB6|nr:hypothetical protein TBLA_0B07680 [Tetrapisispora blattae CBS 6284]CCH59584.1 hypothetical protein TBLA_0B07680 [Tetrapisispora blattae CBS 6284]